MSNENTSLALVHGAPVEISSTRSSFAPKTLTEAITFSELLSKSSMIPKDFQNKPGDIIVAINWGMEIGLAPLQALQNIAVINGRPTIWGDAALGIVQAHHEYIRHEEGVKGEGDKMVGWHTITRKGHQPHTVEFSVADATKAGLWKKAGPWTQYPQRMLKLRARGWAIRDKFSDALKGIITREEAQDMGPTIDAQPITQVVTAEPVVSSEQAMEFFQAWKNVGKKTVEEAKAYCISLYGFADSRKMPLSAFADALAWAKGEVTASAVPEDDEDIKAIMQMFEILDVTEPQQATLLKDYEGRLGELRTVLNDQMDE